MQHEQNQIIDTVFSDHRLKAGYTGEGTGLTGNLPSWMKHISTCQPVKEEQTDPQYRFMDFSDVSHWKNGSGGVIKCQD